MTSYQVAAEALSHMFDSSDEAMKSFSRKGYRPAFDAFYQKYIPAFDAIEELYKTVGDPAQMLENMAQIVVSRAVSVIDEAGSRSKKDAAMMNLNMQLAVYVYPSILHYKGTSSQPLIDRISAGYKEAFPKSNVVPAEVEFIENGFKRKFCYITTAVCQSLGKPDDCYELNLLRSYRDEYLMTSEDGEEKVEEYYDIAPSIIKHIDLREDSAAVYSDIYEAYIAPCIRMIEQDEKEQCKEHYSRMVDDLKNRYFLCDMPS